MSQKTMLAVVMGFFASITLQAQVATNEAKAAALLKKMTLEEKIGQMAQVAIDQVGTINEGTKKFTIDSVRLYDVLVKYKVGSLLNTPNGTLLNVKEWNGVIATIQRFAKKARLAIPVIYGLDDIHGVNFAEGFTSFPQQIGMAATWNRQLATNCGMITANESRAVNVPWSFSPVMDLGVNPQWPRFWETYGEDPFLSGEMGSSFIKGMHNPGNGNKKVEGSLKHFMGYSDPKYGKDRTNAWIPENYLREYHLPSFAAAVKAGAQNVMVNSALINGLPTHMNKHVLTDILKGELSFKGFIVTDWQDIENTRKRDHVAKDNKEALMLCINAGIDMSMVPFNYPEFCNDLEALVREGHVSMSRINDAVLRILRVKYELGLFDEQKNNVTLQNNFGSKASALAAYKTASESITLLKNDAQTLPVPANAKILVTGPNANTMRSLNGGWSYTWQGDKTDIYASTYNTVLEAVQNRFGKGNVSFSEGVVYKMKGRYWEDSIVDMGAVIKAAANVDYIVLCIGENSYTETPGNTEDLNLSGNQMTLAKAAIASGKKVIAVLNEGRPRIISGFEKDVAAIVQVYLPGNYGADALADVLMGIVNPSGKLPYTYPRFANALTPYIHKPSDYIANPQDSIYTPDFNPLYQFGYGLSYTTFKYSDLKINKQSFNANDTITISVKVQNTGKVEGKEVVHLFISDLVASLTPDEKRLRGFEKIELKAGETATVSFNVPLKQLAFINLNNKRQLEAGDFKVVISKLSTTFSLKEGLVF